MIKAAAAIIPMAVLLAVISAPAPALADPCIAIPENGAVPAFLSLGSSFSGPVVEVIDGDSLAWP
jgi:hypothetical protein